MKRFSILLLLALSFLLCTGCAASNVSELRKNGKIHHVYYADDSLQNVFNRTIKKYNECGLPVSNTFIDNNTGEAGASYTMVGQGWYAHTDMKEERKDRIRVDVYSVSTIGLIGDFITMTQYAVDNKAGCPR